jgi:ubiquinone/menaquinone biosynthesis C-methylase UbiE
VSASDSAEVQRRYFERADPARFRWTTASPGFSETEDDLLAHLLERVAPPCLEIGCGEGTNLVRLARRGTCFGVDLFPAKLHFAASELPEVRFAVANAARLPFRSGSFRSVFVRDLLHHVPNPAAVLEEAVRVLAEDGTLCLLEPNGRNPLVGIQTRLVAAEAGARASSREALAALLRDLPLEDVELRSLQPLPLRRVLFHYRFGVPALGRVSGVRAAVSLAERFLGGLLPASRWAYVAASARRR